MYSHRGIQRIRNAFVIIINASWKVVGSNSLRVLQDFFFQVDDLSVPGFIDPYRNFIFCFDSAIEAYESFSSCDNISLSVGLLPASI